MTLQPLLLFFQLLPAFGLGHAVESGGCNWVEVHPTVQPRVLQMCHRVYQPRILHANRINTFLLYAPATPCMPALKLDCPIVEENWQSKLTPTAFYKVRRADLS